MTIKRQYSNKVGNSTIRYYKPSYSYDMVIWFFDAIFKSIIKYSCNTISTYMNTNLGTGSWIADVNSNAIQHMQYLPPNSYRDGEDFIYQRNSSWAVPYTFSGKEKDAETGYSYFGARYYSSEESIWLSVDPLASWYPNESPYCYAGLNPVVIKDPNGKWKEEGDGTWTAEKGDGYWKLHKQAGISLADAKAAVVAANKERGQKRSSETMVYEKDVINLSGGSSDNGGNSKAASTNSTNSSRTNNTSTSTSNSPSNIAVEEKLGNLSTPYGNFATSVNSIKENNPNARYQINMNRRGDFQSINYNTGFQNVTLGPDRATTGNGIVYTGVNNTGQFIIGVSTPRINGVSYSAEMRMNSQQASNAGKAAANAAVVTGGIVYLRRLVPAPFPIVVP